jgi:hypothetical protein
MKVIKFIALTVAACALASCASKPAPTQFSPVGSQGSYVAPVK